VFWVYASNAARFEQGYRDIAHQVKIAEQQDPQADVLMLVHDWLRDCKERWLLVLDSVSDVGFSVDGEANGHDQTAGDSESITKMLRKYLPNCERGSILMTTRNKVTAQKLVEQHDIIAVKPMETVQALALFENMLGACEDVNGIAELAAVLEYIPLAMVQAAAYISQRAPRVSVAKYVDEFKKSECKRRSLLKYDIDQARRDWEAKNSIIATWQTSFDHVQQIRPSAGDLLSLMSFFDQQGIPEILLRGRNKHGDNYTNQKGQEEASSNSDDERSIISGTSFEDDVRLLCNFCFISTGTDTTSFEMHALVQLAIRTWLTANDKLEMWKQRSISSLCAAFPTGEYENWALCQALFAHVKAAAGQQPESESSLYRASEYAFKRGNVADAEELALKSMRARQKVLGQEHEDSLWSMGMVASVYALEGRWDEAEKLLVQVLETRKKRLGVDHPDTLASMASLSSIYGNQGRWNDAEELDVQVLETRKKSLGVGHPDTLDSMANLASVYLSQGRWEGAEELQVQVLEARKKMLGTEHPDTLTSMASLSSIYWNQGQWDKAEELQVQVLEARKKMLGTEHPDTLTSMANLSLIYLSQERWDKAEVLQEQVLKTRKKVLGAEHPDTLTSMASLASIYKNQGRLREAEELKIN
jgi:tetratricopeptide (TPR) repeat protein